MVSVIKSLLFSALTFFVLASVGTLFSALSNNASTLTHQLSFNVRKDACTDDGDFYERSFPIEDRVVDPRDLVRMRARKLPTAASNLVTGEVTTGKINGDSDHLPLHFSRLPVVQLPVGHSLNHQVLYFGCEASVETATAKGPFPLSLPLPYKRVYELVGLAEGGYGYEVKVSFLGSPPTNFDLKLFTLPSSGLDVNPDKTEEGQNPICPSGYRACPCEGNGKENADGPHVDESENMHASDDLFLASGGGMRIRSADASSASDVNNDDSKSTRRRVLDIEKVMFKSAAIGTAEKFGRNGRRSTRGIADEEMNACNKKHACCCRCHKGEVTQTSKALRTPPLHPPPGAGVTYVPNVVTIDKTVAIPYEPEHVVRHFENVAAAAHEFGISFLLPGQGKPTASEDSPQNRRNDSSGGKRGLSDGTATTLAVSVTDPFDRAVLYVRDQLFALSKAFLRGLGFVVGKREDTDEEPQTEGGGGAEKTIHDKGGSAGHQPNRLFAIVSAYPKGESKDQRRQRQDTCSDSFSLSSPLTCCAPRRVQKGGAVSVPLSTNGGTAEEEEDKAEISRSFRRLQTVKFNINLERMYFGQFPLGIFIGLVTGWPVATVMWVAVIPRVVAVARARALARSKKTM